MPLKTHNTSTLPNIHFIGIGGCGMAPLAAYAHHLGYKIQGSDLKASAYIKQLEELGLPIFYGHQKENLRNIDAVVYSSAISPTNIELHYAKELGLNIWHRSAFLSQIAVQSKLISVAGTHGKTSTSALLSYALEALKQKPNAILGGLFVDRGCGYIFNHSDLMVIEADESDSSFLEYNPFINIVTNIDQDHLDHFGSSAQIESAFEKYLQRTSDKGCAIVGWDSLMVRNICHKYNGNLLSFGSKIGCDVRLLDYSPNGEFIEFSAIVIHKQVRARLHGAGFFNLQNALACLATAHFMDLDLDQVAQAFEGYPGVQRRLSLIASSPQIKIYDDYAHNPGKIKTALKALRLSYPQSRIVALFEPHRYTRFQALFDEFLLVFSDVDEVAVFPVYASGESPLKNQNNSVEFSNKLEAMNNKPAKAYVDYEEFIRDGYIPSLAKNNQETVFVSLGAGTINALANKLAALITDD